MSKVFPYKSQTASDYIGSSLPPSDLGLGLYHTNDSPPNSASDTYESIYGEALCGTSPFEATAADTSKCSLCHTPSTEHSSPGLKGPIFSPPPLMESSFQLNDFPISTSLKCTPSSCLSPGLNQPEEAPMLEFSFEQGIHTEDCLTTAHGLTELSETSRKRPNVEANAVPSFYSPLRSGNGTSWSSPPASRSSPFVSPFFPEKASSNHALSQRNGQHLCRPMHIPPHPKGTGANAFESAFFGLTSLESTPSSERKGEGLDEFSSNDHEARRVPQACGVTVHRLVKRSPRFDQFHRSSSIESDPGSEASESRSAPSDRMENKRKQPSHWDCLVEPPDFPPRDRAAAGDLEDQVKWLNHRRSTERRFDELLLSQNSEASSFGAIPEENQDQGTDLSPFLDVEQIVMGSIDSNMEPGDSPWTSQLHSDGIGVEELSLPVALNRQNEPALGANDEDVSAHFQRLGPASDCVVRNLELHDMNETCKPEEPCPRVIAEDKGPKDKVQRLKYLQWSPETKRHGDFRSLPKVELFDASKCTNLFAHIQLTRSMLRMATVISQVLKMI